LSRAAFAFLLAVVLAAGCIGHSGFRVGHASFVIGYMLIALTSIYVSIWRRWDFEIVGWVLLGVFFVGMSMV
jgi:uncharacterized membrane protein YczE